MLVLDWHMEWKVLERSEQVGLMVPLFAMELWKWRAQVIIHPSCNELREGIHRVREHWGCRGTIQQMGKVS